MRILWMSLALLTTQVLVVLATSDIDIGKEGGKKKLEQTPCSCKYLNTGGKLNLLPPISSCTNGVNQVLKCDEKIYSKIGNDLVEFDSISCSEGKWYGTSCTGTVSPLPDSKVKVQCGKTAEPPFCSNLPQRAGLKYIGTFGGMQRYACPDGRMVRTKYMWETTVITNHGNWVECNSAYTRTDSFMNHGPIFEVSCRDYSANNKACSVFATSKAWIHDGVVECEKGFYTDSVGIKKAGDVQEHIYPPSLTPVVRCGLDGWTITGTSHVGMNVSYVRCEPAPKKYGSCSDLDVVYGSVQYEKDKGYTCRYSTQETLNIVTPAGQVYKGNKLECVGSTWTLTGSSAVNVAVGSKVSCVPVNSNALPGNTTSLVSAGFSEYGVNRWTCGPDTTLFIVFASGKTVHAAYVIADDKQIIVTASDTTIYHYSAEKIISAECVDLGPKHFACSTPYDTNGMRDGNTYQCRKGYFIQSIKHKNESYWKSGVVTTITGDQFDLKSIECKKDGWQPQGTPFSGLSVYAVNCTEASLKTIDPTCAETVTAASGILKFDLYRGHATCEDGNTLGYTNNGQDERGSGRKLFCSLNSSTGKREWHWSNLDGSDVSVIPAGAEIKCFIPMK